MNIGRGSVSKSNDAADTFSGIRLLLLADLEVGFGVLMDF